KSLFGSSIHKYFTGAVMIALSTSLILTPIQGITVVSAAEEYSDEHFDADLKMRNDETAKDSEITGGENDTRLDNNQEVNTSDIREPQTTEEPVDVPEENEETLPAEDGSSSPFRRVPRNEMNDEAGGNIYDPN